MIADGTFAPGERLPSMRFMARGGSHGINTVRQAFSLLERDGLVTIRERGGVLVRRRRDLDQPRPPEERFVFWDRAAGDRLDLVLERMGRRDQAFAFAAPGTDLLPERRLSRIFASIPAGWIAYSEPQGEEALRRRIALHYEPVNGPTHAKDILITNGATEAISLIVHTLISAGDVVVVESPTYYDYFRQLSAVDARVIEVRTAVGRGMDLDALEQILASQPVRMVLVQPNVQNPTGATMSDADKARLLSLVHRQGAILVQDDVYGDLSFSDPRPANLSLIGDFSNLILISSFSKTLAPGLRIGFVRATGLMPQLVEAKIRWSLESSHPAQLVLESYLSTPAYPAHLRRLRAALSLRLDEYLALLTDALPMGSTVARPHGGCLLWVSFPQRVDATEIFLRAAKEGVVAVPGELFSAHPHFRNCFRINVGRALIPPRREELLRLCSIVHGAVQA